MDFFERQDQARRKTRWLVVYFFAAILSLVLVLYVVVVAIFFKLQWSFNGGSTGLWRPRLFLLITSATGLVILVGSLQKIFELRSGGGGVASSLGGRPLD